MPGTHCFPGPGLRASTNAGFSGVAGRVRCAAISVWLDNLGLCDRRQLALGDAADWLTEQAGLGNHLQRLRTGRAQADPAEANCHSHSIRCCVKSRCRPIGWPNHVGFAGCVRRKNTSNAARQRLLKSSNAPSSKPRCRSPGEFNAIQNSARRFTFEFDEQLVGWSYFTIEAPAGTVVELLVQEGHEVGGAALLDTGRRQIERDFISALARIISNASIQSLHWSTSHPRRRRPGNHSRRSAFAAIISLAGRRRDCGPTTARTGRFFDASAEHVE